MKVSAANIGLSSRFVAEKIPTFRIRGKRNSDRINEATNAVIAIKNMKETYALNEIARPAFFICVCKSWKCG